jgi:membrane-associated phospholipid phosphatase
MKNPQTVKLFVIPYLIIFSLALTLFFVNGHEAATLWINQHHTEFWDLFFKYATYLGDGFMVVAVVLLLLIFNRKQGIRLAIIGVSLSIISWTLKHLVFGKVPRPKKYFDPEIKLNFVEGVEMHGFHSFPSGHTMTAFVLAFFLASIIKKPVWSVVVLILACVAGFSRIYLFQHFLIDVIVGSVIGVLIALAWTKVFEYWDQQRLKQ